MSNADQGPSNRPSALLLKYGNFINGNQMLTIPIIRYEDFIKQDIKEEIKEDLKEEIKEEFKEKIKDEYLSDAEFDYKDRTINNFPLSNHQEIKQEIINDGTEQKSDIILMETVQKIVKKEVIDKYNWKSNTIKNENTLYTEPETNADIGNNTNLNLAITKKEIITKYQQKPKIIKIKNTLYTDQFNGNYISDLGYDSASFNFESYSDSANESRTGTVQSIFHDEFNNMPTNQNYRYTFSNNEEQNMCGTCNKKSRLVTREIRNSNERAYECVTCMKTFNHRSNVVQHGSMHATEGPFKCNICYKQFSLKLYLSMHEKLHAIELYTCQICNMKFEEKSYLHAHEKLHIDHFFTCAICNKRFNAKSKLSRHERIHTEDKPFVCQVCTKQFTEKSKLSRHERTHTGERPFRCRVCYKEFSRKLQLTNHEIKYHPENFKVAAKIVGSPTCTITSGEVNP